MEIPPLPLYLRTKTNQDITTAVYDRLNYLWSAATVDLPRAPEEESETIEPNAVPLRVTSLSHRLSKEFMNVVKLNKVDMPPFITDRLCGNCCIVLVPSVSYQVRLRPRSRASKANRGKKDRMKNQLVMHCTACNFSWKAAGYIRKNRETPQPPKVITVAPTVPSSGSGMKTSGSKQDVKAAEPGGADKRKFSFLSKINGPAATQERRMSAPPKLDSKDFMSFSAAPKNSLSESNSSSLQSLSKGFFARGSTPSAAGPSTVAGNGSGGGAMTLLELEALHKKNKRKKV